MSKEGTTSSTEKAAPKGDVKNEHKPNEKPAAEDAEALKEALCQEKAKAESYLANWQRAQADYINYKKRADQERGEATKFANALLIANLLPVVDDFERALSCTPDNLGGLSWVDGLRLIYRKMVAVLESQGLSEIKALGETFDPNLHEAALHGEGEVGKVVSVLQKGYKLNDKVIRPAVVMVGEGTKENPKNKQSSE